jgi:hypothetical protein
MTQAIASRSASAPVTQEESGQGRIEILNRLHADIRAGELARDAALLARPAASRSGGLSLLGDTLAVSFGIGGICVALLLPGAIQELTGHPIPMSASALIVFQIGLALIGLLLAAAAKLMTIGLDSPQTASRTLNLIMAIGFPAILLGVLLMARVI